ncbi:MAG: hypothetical protein IJU70_05325 [Lentisphaeria bacterium]|nr:hypothetical protein [Lentisphaeria bacterium]
MAVTNMTVECRGCGAAISLDPALRFGTCPYCGNRNTLFVSGTDVTEIPAVEYAYPAKISERTFRSAVRAFLCTDPDVPDSLYESLEEREFVLNFWPFFRHEIEWTANWSANIGYDDDNAKNGIAWQGSTGQAVGTAAVYAPASSIIHKGGFGRESCRLAANCSIEPLRFHPDLLNGISWLSCDVEASSMEKDYVSPVVNKIINGECAEQLPGDYQRDMRTTNRIDSRKTTLQMIPYWLFVYEWNGKSYFVVQNAVSGAVGGTLPTSNRRKWIAAGLTLFAILLSGLTFWAMWNLRNEYEALLVLVLILPTACFGMLYREAILKRKSRLKLVPAEEVGELLLWLKAFERSFITLSCIFIPAWVILSLLLVSMLPVVMPGIWGVRTYMREPTPPEEPHSERDARQGQKKKVVKLKLRKIGAISEEIQDDDGNTFVVEK